MKTLDEVIKAFECCYIHKEEPNCSECPYKFKEKFGLCGDQRLDALYYLKEYQKIEKNFSYDELQELRDWWAEEHVINEPLSWDELKQMEGKPVWVEYDGYKPMWDIVRYNRGGVIETEMCMLHEEGQGKTWQAYRKERK